VNWFCSHQRKSGLLRSTFVRSDSGDLRHKLALSVPEVMGLLHAQPQRRTIATELAQTDRHFWCDGGESREYAV